MSQFTETIVYISMKILNFCIQYLYFVFFLSFNYGMCAPVCVFTDICLEKQTRILVTAPRTGNVLYPVTDEQHASAAWQQSPAQPPTSLNLREIFPVSSNEKQGNAMTWKGRWPKDALWGTGRHGFKSPTLWSLSSWISVFPFKVTGVTGGYRWMQEIDWSNRAWKKMEELQRMIKFLECLWYTEIVNRLLSLENRLREEMTCL